MSGNKEPIYTSGKEQVIAAKIKFFRKAAGLTQSELAEEVSKYLNESNISQTLISKYEKGQAVPPLDKVAALSKALGVSAAALLNVEESGAEYVPERGVFLIYDKGSELARADLLRSLFYYQQSYTCARLDSEYWLLHSEVEQPNNIVIHKDELEALIRTIETMFNTQFESLKKRATRSDKYIKIISDEEVSQLRDSINEEG